MAKPIMMESSKSSKRIWSLPGGDRRGTLGADAERSSMQAIGGEGNGRPSAGEPEKCESNRRYNLRPLTTRRRPSAAGQEGRDTPSRGDAEVRLAPIEEWSSNTISGAEKVREASLSVSSPISLFPSLPSSPQSYLTYVSEHSVLSPPSPKSSLAEDVVQMTTVTDAAPAKASKRTRKKWTEEMNSFVLRTYLRITKLETDTRSYLTDLHRNFLEKFPAMQVTKQRLGDQRRAIVRSNLLTADKIAQIRTEVERQLITTQPQLSQSQPPHPSQPGVRIKWTTEHNETIIREYYRITQLETNRTAYRKPLHQYFGRMFPHLAHLSEQRIADQRRLIIKNNLIATDRITIIKSEVANEIGFGDNTSTRVDEPVTFNHEEIVCHGSLDSYTPHNILTELNLEPNTLEQPDRNDKIDVIFQQALQFFNNTEPVGRPYIPKQKTSKKFAKIVNYLNEVTLPETVNINTGFDNLQTALYSAAWTAAKINGSNLQLPPEEPGNRTKRDSKPRWQRRLQDKIEDLRKKIGRLTHYINGNRSTKLTGQVNKILESYRIHSIHEEPNTDLTHFLDTLKQKLTVLSSRLRRYTSCTLRKTQNSQFSNNEKKFYQNLSKTNNRNPGPNSSSTASVNPSELRQFWANIWENPVSHNKDAGWINDECVGVADTQDMQEDNIPVDVFQKVLREMHNWKAPGSDHLHSFWYKKFTCIHPFLYNYITMFIRNPNLMPAYFTDGVTYMIPKDQNNLSNPAKYRPITCLQTIYKITTACISQIIYQHISYHNILSEQQKGCRKFSQGCKEQLVIDSTILKQVQKKKRDLFTTYIDYQKAYDSVPHSWLIYILEIYKVHPHIVTFLSHAMSKWYTRLHTLSVGGQIETDPIQIQRGIFQGDALSPLWFCLALNPLSNILNSLNVGYTLNNTQPLNSQTDATEYKLNHLLYMDDIKLYASTQPDLEQLIFRTEQFSHDINMQFGIEKCKINSVRAGLNYQHRYEMQSGDTISPLEETETYKYLGYNQSKLIHCKEIKNKLILNFKHRLNAILKSQLYSKNTTKAINTYAIPILTYSFGILNWTKKDLKDLQRIVNVTMTKNRKHHPRACIQRQVLPRLEGGRGIINIQNLHNKQITTLRSYFHKKAESSVLHRLISQNDNKFTPLNLKDLEEQKNEGLTDMQTLIQEWIAKSLHGRHRHDLCQPNVDKEASNEWLSRGELFPETEGFMIAIQDQVIETRNYKKHIMKARNLQTDLCRKCNSSSETIQHITGACKSIVQTDYKFRHDQVANIIHQRLATKYKLTESSDRPTPYYKYTPETVLENTTHKLYFDRAILTDKTIHYNRPDLTLIDKHNKTALIIDIAIPNTHNLQTTIAEKLSKYTDLREEITRMWRLDKVTIIPIVISTTGVIPSQLFHSLELLDLPKHLFALLQKSVILNTCRIVRKFLQITASSEIPSSTHTGTTDAHLA